MRAAERNRALLWLAPVLSEKSLGTAAAQLGVQERQRCERIKHKAARERFLTGRAMIRLALSDVAGGDVAPSAWTIESGANGKPVVTGPRTAFGISIAHTENMVAVAVCPDEDVGVDIECLDDGVRAAPLAAVLSEADKRKLKACRHEDRGREFVRLWTMKEAYAKWTGDGVGLDFAKLDFDWTPGRAEENVRTEDAGIYVRFFALAKEYCVALTMRRAYAPDIRFDNLEARLSPPGDELADLAHS